MITVNDKLANMIISPVRKIEAKVELFDGSTLAHTFTQEDKIISFQVERVAEDSKFFGMGVTQHLKLDLIDTQRELEIDTDYSIKLSFGVGGEYFSPFPTFHVVQCRRDENTNQLSVYGYDALNAATAHYLSELTLGDSYTLEEFVGAIVSLLGIEGLETKEDFSLSFIRSNTNFEGTETFREALDDVAEVTQTIYYIDSNDYLVFKRLDKDAAPDVVIGKEDYFTLESKDNRRLSAITSATELGDDITSSIEAMGTTQYVRDNMFWTLREDLPSLLDNAIAAVGGLTINQFTLDWRGNFTLELGDKIAMAAKDNSAIEAYILDDVVTYDGSFTQKTQWSYTDSDETASNPSTLGDALKQTFAKVDKANKQVDIVVGSVATNTINISALQMTTENITASVEDLEGKIEASMTTEDIKIEIQKQLEESAVTEVTTKTGFTFNSDGLTVEKSGSEMTTRITEDGMIVYKNNTAVLTADNIGVNATNLHATTFLIIGENSRFEDYGSDRTGCFWIGG